MVERFGSPARAVGTVIAAVLLVGALALVLPRWWILVRPHPDTPVAAEQVEAARVALGSLPIVAPLDLAEYDREFFGPAWRDPDGAACDTRNRVLAAWLSDVAVDPLNPCLVDSGWFVDPYTGAMLSFERGPRSSREVQIDHVVALADAWRKGAAAWPPGRAQRFANDLANLIPTDAAANRAKGAADASDWLPPNEGYRCAYAVQQVLVKEAYGLGVDSEEAGALGGELLECPETDAPVTHSVRFDAGSAAGAALPVLPAPSAPPGPNALSVLPVLSVRRDTLGPPNRHPGPSRSGKQRHRVRARPHPGIHAGRPRRGLRVRPPPPGRGPA